MEITLEDSDWRLGEGGWQSGMEEVDEQAERILEDVKLSSCIRRSAAGVVFGEA